ncbi:MAG: preprotein translocase subunit SecE [Gammaproteobacteria bacterium]|nr:preprotein translocase subunit SecE [Gammaproteobacteria bacterium]
MTVAKQTNVGTDIAKLVLAIALLVLAIFGYHYYESAYLLIYRLLALVLVVGIAGFISSQTAGGRSFWQFAGDARAEMRKVSYPTTAETTQTTLVIAVLVLIASILLWLIDLGLSWMIKQLLSIG